MKDNAINFAIFLMRCSLDGENDIIIENFNDKEEVYKAVEHYYNKYEKSNIKSEDTD